MKLHDWKVIIAAGMLALFSSLPLVAQERFQASGSGGDAPGDPQRRAKLHTELGGLYFSIGNLPVALDELKIAIDASSSYHHAYSVRGLVYTALKEYAKAREDFATALRLAPNDPQVNNNYGWFLCDSGKAKESVEYFLKALRDPLYDTPEIAYANAGTCAIKGGDNENGERYLLQAVQFSRDGAPMARVQLAGLYFAKGYIDEARRYLNEALKMLEPPPAAALWLGVRLERKLGNKVAEASYGAQLRSRYPSSPEYQEFLKGNFE